MIETRKRLNASNAYINSSLKEEIDQRILDIESYEHRSRSVFAKRLNEFEELIASSTESDLLLDAVIDNNLHLIDSIIVQVIWFNPDECEHNLSIIEKYDLEEALERACIARYDFRQLVNDTNKGLAHILEFEMMTGNKIDFDDDENNLCPIYSDEDHYYMRYLEVCKVDKNDDSATIEKKYREINRAYGCAEDIITRAMSDFDSVEDFIAVYSRIVLVIEQLHRRRLHKDFYQCL